jgi:hypothetical protein
MDNTAYSDPKFDELVKEMDKKLHKGIKDLEKR